MCRAETSDYSAESENEWKRFWQCGKEGGDGADRSGRAGILSVRGKSSLFDCLIKTVNVASLSI